MLRTRIRRCETLRPMPLLDPVDQRGQCDGFRVLGSRTAAASLSVIAGSAGKMERPRPGTSATQPRGFP